MRHMRIDPGADGIATLIFDYADGPMNVIGDAFTRDFEEATRRLTADATVTGVIVTSAKREFLAGADLKELVRALGGMTRDAALDFCRRANAMHRAIERSGKPWVAAINGLVLGGGLELALSCHGRVMVDDPRLVVGLPEVTLGMLPGSGGLQRLIRTIDLWAALDLLLTGRLVSPAEALALGMIDALVPREELMESARQWLSDHPDPVRPWDRPGAVPPQGERTAAADEEGYARAAARIARRSGDNYPAPWAILSAVREGARLPLDAALAVEGRYCADLLTNPVARGIIRTTFVNKGAADKGAARPVGTTPARLARIGVIGGGDGAAAIAKASARAGMAVVDEPSPAACDIVLTLEPDVAMAGAISVWFMTLPSFSGTGAGLYFPTALDRPGLVEIVAGDGADDATVGLLLDYALRLRRTPIISHRQSYVLRGLLAFLLEGRAMLAEGVPAALIEEEARAAGMAEGPLARIDALGGPALLPGAQALPGSAQSPSHDRADLRARFLHVQALEAVRCLEEGVVTTPADADLGSVYGWGFPVWTGGGASYVDMLGSAAFVATADRLADRYGDRFAVPDGLRAMAARDARYHD